MYRNYTEKLGMPPRYIYKLMLIMRLTTVILIATILQVSAASFAQKVTLSEKKAPLKEVFKELRKQTHYDFICTDELFETAKMVNINVRGVELKDVLDQIFKDQPLNYTIDEKTVVISTKELSFIDKAKEAVKDFFTNTDVTGRVLDEQGLPIASATVTVKGTSNATITDAAGYFHLANVDDKASIVISVIGYEKMETPVKANVGSIRLTIALSKLDEVQVIAYDQTSQRLSLGNIGKISSKEIEEQPVNNPLLALEGRVAGLFITQNTGVPGGGVTVRIQGQNSINQGSDPLYIVDGMPISAQNNLLTVLGPLGTSGGRLNGGSSGAPGSPLSFLNPSDIESIEILKDAEATAIYGARASNGAILITTKKGKIGQMKVDINLQQGVGHVTHELPMLNTQQYLQMRLEEKKNDNAAISATDYDINGLWDQSRYTDWQKTLIGGNAQYSDFNGSISGGTTAIQYLIGGTYHRETTVFPGDFNDQKGSLHFSLSGASTNQRFRFQLTGNFLADNDQLPKTDLTSTAILLEPDAPALYKSDGTLNWEPNSSGTSTWTNPLSLLLVPFLNKTSNLISNALLSYNILPGLEIKTTFGYNSMNSNAFQAQNVIAATKPESRLTTSRSASYSMGYSNTWNIEPQITYKKSIAKGVLNLLAGATILQNNTNTSLLSGSGYNSDDVMQSLSSATALSGNSVISQYKYNSIFGRVNYNWQDSYIVEATARRDGTSRFGSGNQFHDFWSVGGGWIFTSEDVFKKDLSFVSFGKLKASYGTTGNDQIANYSYLNQYNNINNIVAYQGIASLAPGGLNNPNIAWEETRKLSIGADIGFLKDRILLDVSYARNSSSNELLSYPLPAITGFTSVFQNLGATVQNTSWEFVLNTINIKGKDFHWNSSFNLTIPKNTLTSYPGLASSTLVNTYVIGQSLNLTKAYHFLGVDPATGNYIFSDINGNPTTSPIANRDNYVLIDLNPKYYGGVQNSLSYKNLHLDFLFSFTKQKGPNYIYANPQALAPGSFFAGFSNQPITVLNRWQNPGDMTSIKKFTTSSLGSIPSSDAYYADASYIRLKNVSLSYSLPDEWIKRVHFQNCRIYLQGQNLLTITNFNGMDPENLSGSSLPPLRVITVGLQVGL